MELIRTCNVPSYLNNEVACRRPPRRLIRGGRFGSNPPAERQRRNAQLNRPWTFDVTMKRTTTTTSTAQVTAEHRRLIEHREKRHDWKSWGPYLAERAWGTVREDYSPDGAAWD